MITISQAIEIINGGSPVDLVAVTFDRHRRTGGKRIHLKAAVRAGSNHSTKINGTVTLIESEAPHRHPVTVHVALIEKINGLEVL